MHAVLTLDNCAGGGEDVGSMGKSGKGALSVERIRLITNFCMNEAVAYPTSSDKEKIWPSGNNSPTFVI